MHDSQLISDASFTGEDPLGPVATMPAVTFGAREAALAGVGRGMAGIHLENLSTGMLTGHITCSSITFINDGPHRHE